MDKKGLISKMKELGYDCVDRKEFANSNDCKNAVEINFWAGKYPYRCFCIYFKKDSQNVQDAKPKRGKTSSRKVMR